MASSGTGITVSWYVNPMESGSVLTDQVPFLIIQLAFLTFAFRDQNGPKYREAHNVQDASSGKGASRTKIVYMCGFFYFFYLAVEGK